LQQGVDRVVRGRRAAEFFATSRLLPLVLPLVLFLLIAPVSSGGGCAASNTAWKIMRGKRAERDSRKEAAAAAATTTARGKVGGKRRKRDDAEGGAIGRWDRFEAWLKDQGFRCSVPVYLSPALCGIPSLV